MCKFLKPQIPANVTADEKRAIYFDALCSLDLSDKVEKYNDLTYVSWANAWAEFKRCYPSATYRIIKNPETNLPYFADPLVGIMVYTEVTVEGITHEMWLPVMNNANKAMKLEPYAYQVWDKDKRQYVDKTVQAATMFDINKTMVDTQQSEGKKPAPRRVKTTVRTQQVNTTIDKYAGIKAALNACTDQQSLMNLYQQHKNEVDSNREIKALFTERKLQLQKAA